MKQTFSTILLVLLSITAGSAYSIESKSISETIFYVSPDGSDSNSGAEESPLATLVGARDAIRKFKSSGEVTAPIVVSIKGGTYEMKESLVLLPEDGGTAKFPITYRAEEGSRPIFSGGKKITGFTSNESGVWEAKIPECSYYNWRFDQLYVNGDKATLARTPNSGFLKMADVKQNIWESGSGRVATKAQQIITFDEHNSELLKSIKEDEADQVRFRAYHKWDFTLRFLDKVELESDSVRIFTSGKGMKPWNPLKKDGRILFENYYAALDSVSEWFLNREGVLFYSPREGESIDNTTIIAPVLENIISVEGDASNGNLVENINFEGLTFAHCHFQVPAEGSEPNQAAALLNAAVMLEGARSVNFTDCEISKTGQHALWYGKGCSNSSVEHCFLNKLGGGGVYLGDFKPQKDQEHTHSIKLNNNIIKTGGQEFPSAVGVWIGHSSDNSVTHNDIGNFYYSGVSVGWTWGYDDSSAKRNIVTDNVVHHIGWTLLSDMAAVYTLGKSEGTVVSNNVVHHVHAYSYGGWGLYTDEGSSGIVMENNLVYSTKTGGFHQHYGKDNIIRNNIFAYAKLYQIQCTRVEEHRSFDYVNNINIFEEGVVMKGVWEKIDILMDSNLYWNSAGDDYIFNEKSFAEWQKTGHDVNSIIADPNFKDASNFDFTFKNKRTVKRIGFKPFDYSEAGVYGDDSWREKVELSSSITEAFDALVEINMSEKTGRN